MGASGLRGSGTVAVVVQLRAAQPLNSARVDLVPRLP